MPKRTKPAANSPPELEEERVTRGPGRPPKYDWFALWQAYVFADTPVSYADLAAIKGAPSKRQIERVASDENWQGQREEFRRQVVGKIHDEHRQFQTEVRLMHAKFGKAVLSLAVRGLSYIKPEDLGAQGVYRLGKLGTEVQRKALGIEEVTVNFADLKTPDDLKRLPTEQLLALLADVPE